MGNTGIMYVIFYNICESVPYKTEYEG